MADVEQGKELRDLKMLMILQLLNDGLKQSQIAQALGVSPATLSRMLPKGLGRELARGARARDNGIDDNG